MCNLHNQALVYAATLNTAIRKTNATPIRATINTNVEKRCEKKKHHNSVSFETNFQFLSKAIFEIFLSTSFYAKKYVQSRAYVLCMTP